MLVVERHVGEQLTVVTPSGNYTIYIVKVMGQKVAVGIDAPREWPIERPDMKSKGPATDASPS